MNKKISRLIIIFFLTVVGFIIISEIRGRKNINEYASIHPSIDQIQVIRRVHGKILPTEEIEVKSKINGIVDRLYIEVGEKVVTGQRIAVIRNISEPIDIENLKSTVKLYEIQLQTARLNYERETKLADAGLSTAVEHERTRSEVDQLTEQLESARKRLQMATSGVVTSERDLSNIIYAPATGTILSLYAKAGSPVIKQNSFSEGTTLAIIADMKKLKFYGKIPESYLSELHEGQEILIKTLINDQNIIRTKINKIYPRGEDEDGVVKFPIEANIYSNKEKLWGGINATAEIIVAKKDSILCVEEKYLSYKNDTCYSYVLNDQGDFIKRRLITGISDGLKTEIIDGLTTKDKIKLPEFDR